VIAAAEIPSSGSFVELKATNDGTITHAPYEIYCPIDGHRGQGMAGTLAVRSGSSSGGMTTGETTTSGGPGY
jgi:hypothetical protein